MMTSLGIGKVGTIELYKVCEAASIMPVSFPGLGVHEDRVSKVHFSRTNFSEKAA